MSNPVVSQDDEEVTTEIVEDWIKFWGLGDHVVAGVRRELRNTLTSDRASVRDAARLAGEQAERTRVLLIIYGVAKQSAVGGPVALACLKIANGLQGQPIEGDK